MKIIKLIRFTPNKNKAWVLTDTGVLIKKRLSQIPRELLKATPEPQKATPEPLEGEIGVIAGMCQECGETGEHKIWCSKYAGRKIARHELAAEKELDTTYKEDLNEIAKFLEEDQKL